MEEEKAKELILHAIGQGSMCWEHVDGAGFFMSHRAIKIADQLLIDLELKSLPEQSI